MDKEEYRIRLTTIQTMAAQQDFNAAAEVADTVDWKRVKSIRTLLMVEEIYEAAGRYEDAKRVLNCAYWRAHTSKTILYRLTEINIKTGDLSEALKYCDEFELLSPKDEKKYLLRYKLFTARKDPIESRIRVLEAYRETKFSEKWAYELAGLYHENGQDEQCVQLLDDMIVWFPDGKYRERAKALRDTLKGPEQAEEPKKEEPLRRRNTVEIKVEPPRRRPERPIVEDAFRRTEDSAVKTQLADSFRTLVSGIRSEEPVLEVPETVVSWPEESPRRSDSAARKVKDLEPEMIGRTTIAPPAASLPEDGVQLTIDDYMNGSSPKEKNSELDDLLSETSAHLASAVASGQYDRISTQSSSGKKSDVPAGQMSFDDFLPEMEDESEEPRKEMDPLAKLYGKETDETLGLTKSYGMEEDVVREIARQEKQKASEEEEKRRRRAVAETLRSAGVITEETSADEREDAWTEPEEPSVEIVSTEAKDADAASEEAVEVVPDSESIEQMLREAEEEDEEIVRVPKKKARADFGGWIGRILHPEEDEDAFSDEEGEEETASEKTDVSDEKEIADEKTAVRAEAAPEEESAGKAAAVTAAEEAIQEKAEELTAPAAEAESTAAAAESAPEVLSEKAVKAAAQEADMSGASAPETEEEDIPSEEEDIPSEDEEAASEDKDTGKGKKTGRLMAFFRSLGFGDDDEEFEDDEDDAVEEEEEEEEEQSPRFRRVVKKGRPEKEETDGGEKGSEEDLSWIDELKDGQEKPETPGTPETDPDVSENDEIRNAPENAAADAEEALKSAAEEAEAKDTAEPESGADTAAAAAAIGAAAAAVKSAAEAADKSAENDAAQEPEESGAEPETAGAAEEPEDLIEAITSRPETLKKLPVEPRSFDETEKKIFSYFTKVPGMSEQITMALADVHNNAGDKTSRSGNIMIIGRQGSGKTHLTDAIMTAVCRDLGITATRSAKIIASEFNEKNPAEIVSRLMGGFLVIEGAGELRDDVVEKLLRAMEFRTDHLVVMLEDEKADLKALLLRHPEIEEKFTSTIVIPVFTNDELVTFAKSYAQEKGYRMDEMGILALYTMIGDNQSATEPVTVGKVKEMMDAAIAKAESGTRKIGRVFGKRSVDKDGKIILREKDFDI